MPSPSVLCTSETCGALKPPAPASAPFTHARGVAPRKSAHHMQSRCQHHARGRATTTTRKQTSAGRAQTSSAACKRDQCWRRKRQRRSVTRVNGRNHTKQGGDEHELAAAVIRVESPASRGPLAGRVGIQQGSRCCAAIGAQWRRGRGAARTISRGRCAWQVGSCARHHRRAGKFSSRLHAV